jgi:pimeloyl-ACP methyl ester carboxylesterase
MPLEKIARVLGRRIHYVESGEGEAVLLLHGLGGSKVGWSGNLRALSRGRRVLALDQIGFGLSEKPAIDYTSGVLVEHLLEFLRQLGIGRASLVGSSMGGEVALRLALARPEKVAKLVLVASGGLRSDDGDPDVESGVDPSPPSLEGMREFLVSLFHDRGLVTEDLVHLAFENHEAYGDAETIRRFQRRRTLEAPLEDAELGAIRAPALIVWGRQDRLTPVSLGERMAKAIVSSRLVVLEECGHLPQIERAAEFNEVVDAFLSER